MQKGVISACVKCCCTKGTYIACVYSGVKCMVQTCQIGPGECFFPFHLRITHCNRATVRMSSAKTRHIRAHVCNVSPPVYEAWGFPQKEGWEWINPVHPHPSDFGRSKGFQGSGPVTPPPPFFWWKPNRQGAKK